MDNTFSSMAAQARAANTDLGHTTIFSRLQDGPTSFNCSATEGLNSTCDEISESFKMNSTLGLVETNNETVSLNCVHSVLNVFELSSTSFFTILPKSTKSTDDVVPPPTFTKNVHINCPERATIVINLDGGFEKCHNIFVEHERKLRYLSPTFKLTGGCASEQILVNLPCSVKELRLALNDNGVSSSLPFSIFAPYSRLRIDDISIVGQVVAQAIEIKGECNISCPLFQGSGGCIEPSTAFPSSLPSAKPSQMPSKVPSVQPSMGPSVSSEPSLGPSSVPTSLPSDTPSSSPSSTPSDEPSFLPSVVPSEMPSKIPTQPPQIDLSETPLDDPPPLSFNCSESRDFYPNLSCPNTTTW
eukprot:CAMPEP_0185822534 /NCGR_PEP_ID=MMETSP1322-20130828/26896_1 /TAXON_ID=265543 /ORGANISM="Minutocellus polymorphus, Strain RCC2270" /LENGTH=356 /DNA_ID=CAMNT_0028520011 /DNA_START=13 /DNA_END=1080 /DNA_ORIENTATION=-